MSPGNGPDSAYVRDIFVHDNAVVANDWGRGLTVVGGKRIELAHNFAQGGASPYACIYLAEEGSYATWEANQVYVHDNQLVQCGGPNGTGHPASLLVYAANWPNRDIRIENNGFWQNRGSQGSIAIQGTNINVTQSGNTTDVGAVPAAPF